MIILIVMLYRCKLVLFCWVALVSLIPMLFTMVELINILLCTRERKLLPLTPNEIVQCDRAIAKTAKCESENQHDQTAPPSSSNAIKLKSHAMLATRSDLLAPPTIDAPFYALVCRQVLFSLDDITTPLPHAITNFL
jgi:hypothetical protein